MHDRVTRHSIEFLLDVIELSRAGGDVVDRLIVAAVLDANVAPIKHSPALQQAYAAVDQAPPEERRRPISMNALASSLHLPSETLRRRVRRLIASGVLVSTATGVLLSQSALESDAFQRLSLARYERLLRFLATLSEHPDLAPSAAEALNALRPSAPGRAPVRLANRHLAEYVMRFIESMTQLTGDPVAALLLLHIGRANLARSLDPSPAFAGFRTEQLSPIGAVRLARNTNLAAKVVDRRLQRLAAQGAIERTPLGAVVSRSWLRQPQVRAVGERNLASLGRLLWALSRAPR